MNEKKILNDEQYHKSLEWLVEKAQLIEHPLLDDAQRKKLIKQYDFVAARVREYRQRDFLQTQDSTQEQEELKPVSDWLGD